MQPQPERETCAFYFRPQAAQNELIRDQQVFRKRTEWNCYFPKRLLKIKERRSIFPLRRSNQRYSLLKVIKRSFSSSSSINAMKEPPLPIWETPSFQSTYDLLPFYCWGSVDHSIVDAGTEESQQKLEKDFDSFTTTKASSLAPPLVEAQVPFKIHIVKDHDMKKRLCLEVDRLGLNAVIMGSLGFRATRRGNDGKLGSASDYCVRHCVCPIVVVRYPDEKDGSRNAGDPVVSVASAAVDEDEEYLDANDERKACFGWFTILQHQNRLFHLKYGLMSCRSSVASTSTRTCAFLVCNIVS